MILSFVFEIKNGDFSKEISYFVDDKVVVVKVIVIDFDLGFNDFEYI